MNSPLNPLFYNAARKQNFSYPMGDASDMEPAPDIGGSTNYSGSIAPSAPRVQPSLQGTNEYQDYLDTGAKLRAALNPNPVSTPRALLGALVSRHNPQLGSVITGDYQRQRAIQPLMQQEQLLGTQLDRQRQLDQQRISNQNIQSEIQHRGKQEDYWQQLANAKQEPPPKGAVDKAIDDLVGQPNPDTGKPYGYADAFAHIQDVVQGAKPGKNPVETPHTVVVGDRVRQWNPKTNKFDIDVGPSPKSVAPEKPSPSDTTFDKANAAQVTKDLTTARGADFRFRSMNGSYKDATEKNDQQAMLNLLTNHIGMTLGLQKGARITKDILHEATASAPWLQSVAAKFDSNGYLSGVVLTKGQMDSMMKLAKAQRHTAWQQAHDSASQAGLTDKVQFPSDFVPEGESAPKTQGNTITLDDFLKEPH